MAKASGCDFENACFTFGEVSAIAEVNPSTLRNWATGNGQARAPLITAVEDPYWKDVLSIPLGIPFGGMVEAFVIAAIRKSGVSLQRIRAAINICEQSLEMEHVLASEAFYLQGPRLLYDACFKDIATEADGKWLFTPLIDKYLSGIEFEADGYAERVHLSGFEVADVVVDDRMCGGGPMFVAGGVRVEHVFERLCAGESLSCVAEDYNIPEDHIRDALRRESAKTSFHLAKLPVA